MTTELRKIDFKEFKAELPELLETLARDGEQVLVENEGKVYRVGATAEPSGHKQHDPERLRRMLVETRGAFKGIDVEALKRDLREARQQDSDGRPA